MTASQWRIWASDTGARESKAAEGSSREDLSSCRRRFVDGGVGDREGAMVGWDLDL